MDRVRQDRQKIQIHELGVSEESTNKKAPRGAGL